MIAFFGLPTDFFKNTEYSIFLQLLKGYTGCPKSSFLYFIRL